ncbi:Gamma-aminobutyraldehyde dehydrogenase [Leclercia adecarboxylata]|uniref:Gamma-aminobutyraldehyde dehydrogenase n=1 Tax=Leclercia adecarboxylata TaxID=83655 RepID=A0A4U9HJE7_9ENTR|nr:Gamma-aminobutyraldehyde dehydrogenase [Leclercia adecarboxylata]
MQHNLLINGELIAGSGEKQPVYNPATGEVLLEIAEASPEQVDAAVQAADRAFRQWGQTTPKARAECLLKLADVIEQNADTFARLESLNCGKPLHCVLNDEIPAIVDVFRFFGGGHPLPERPRRRGVSGRAHLHDPPRSGGRGGLHRPVELPADDGGVEARPGAGGGELRGA